MSHRSSQKQRASGIRAVWTCLAVALVVQTVRAASGTPWRETTDGEERGKPLLPVHHLSKRSFFNIECKGVYDKVIFARLDRICEDCYNLFREAQLHSLCMKKCFTSKYFMGCVEALQLSDEIEQIQSWIKQVHGGEPGV